jgi:hypothetical protein
LTSKEVVIFIHGITRSPEPVVHTQDYDDFEDLLKEEFKKRDKKYPSQRIDIEWGFKLPSITTGDRILADTEKYLYDNVKKISGDHFDFTINPLRFVFNNIRKEFFMGFADLFYYVSEDGKEEVRKNVFNTLLNKLSPLKDDESYTLTIVAHSAGSVIMHDILFILNGGSSKSFVTDPQDFQKLELLKSYAAQGKLRLKCFVTIGSPIAPLIVRSRKLLDLIYNNGAYGKIDPEGIGLKVYPDFKSIWLNFWDKDDIISSPVAFLYYDRNGHISDIYADIGDSFPSVHSKYWCSPKIAKTVAERW